VLVIGAAGQVGSALLARLGADAIGWTRAELDLAEPERIATALDAAPAIDAVINAAAYTAVDRAEVEEPLAHAINAAAPAAIARWAAGRRVPLVHYSTDYVFPGTGDRPWTEDDEPAPLGAYGRSKLAGEREVASAGCAALILRTQWVYDRTHTNFLTAILAAADRPEPLRVVADQIGAPTSAATIARATVDVLRAAVERPRFPGGVYHLRCDGETSWHGFACEILRLAGIDRPIAPITTAERPAAAVRPRNSRLAGGRLAERFGVRPPDWRTALSECMA
jgi:dTDP-4-dehydrorhamnose reductase